MASYKLSLLAEIDLLDIVESTIENWGRNKAREYALLIDEVLEKLVRYPEIGLQRNELYQNARSFPAEKLIIYYCYANDTVKVARILHQRMDPTEHL